MATARVSVWSTSAALVLAVLACASAVSTTLAAAAAERAETPDIPLSQESSQKRRKTEDGSAAVDGKSTMPGESYYTHCRFAVAGWNGEMGMKQATIHGLLA